MTDKTPKTPTQKRIDYFLRELEANIENNLPKYVVRLEEDLNEVREEMTEDQTKKYNYLLNKIK